MKKKICLKCGKLLPLTKKYFYKRKVSRDGYAWWCIKCWKDYEKSMEGVIVGMLKL